MFRKSILAAMVAASLGSIAVPGVAAQYGFRHAPPPPREEVVPAARPGYVYVPGHWDERNHKYYWVKGTFVKERRGYRYEEARWVERNGRWYHVKGNWRRGDRDHDGVPNRVDRDRDGDGVPNRDDRRPDNPRRY
jgi:hypothetical protein